MERHSRRNKIPVLVLPGSIMAKSSRLRISARICFFFSSRRRHTRSLCDWSSDVCSSDLDNAIWLSESDESIRAKTKVMMTDPARKRRQDPGNPDVCPVFSWHKLFSPPETIAWSDQGCRTAAIGCIDCKAAMADNLIRWIEPIRARRREYEADPERVREILHEGSNKARKVAT